MMEKFYTTLKQVKGMDIDLSKKEDSKKFCSILQDLASEYKPECNWLKRVMEKEMHLQFLGKKDVKLSEKKQIIGRMKNQLETEEGFAEKAIQKIIISFMILGDWEESYDDIMNGENFSKSTKKTQGATSKNKANNMSSSPKTSLNDHRAITLSIPTASEVVKVHVAVGKLVSRGDVILTVKISPSKKVMDIVASQNGRIVTIAGVGEKVKGGDTLAVIMEFVQAKKSKNASQNTSHSNYSANTQNKNQTTNQSSASAHSRANSTPKGNNSNRDGQSFGGVSGNGMSSPNIADNVKKTNVGGIAAIVAVVLVIFVGIGLSSMSQNSGTARNSDTNNVVSKEEKTSEDVLSFDSNVSIGDTVTFGKENREWIVLDKEDEKALLLTKESVGERVYHDKRTDITWEDCTLREWLNEEFYHDSFTEAEKNQICETAVKNDDNPKYGTEGGRDTTDKIFLLSIDEAEKYFENDEARAIGSWWRLRSPGDSSYSAAFVSSDGYINQLGLYVNIEFSVRPALWVNLES